MINSIEAGDIIRNGSIVKLVDISVGELKKLINFLSDNSSLKYSLQRVLMAINIGGDSVDSITIDGDQVQEVTIDGNVVWSANTVPDTVVSHWKIDEGSGSTLYDSEDSNNGNINGATWQSNSNRVGGYWLSFNEGDNVNFGNPANIDPAGRSSFTTAITFRIDGGDTAPMPISKKGDSNDNVLIYFIDGDIKAGYDIGSTGSSNNYTYWSSYSTGDLVRLVLTFDGSTIRLYANGTEVATNSESGSIADGSNDWQIGFADTSTRYDFDGFIDNVIIDTTTWNATQVSEDYERQPWT